MFFISVFQWRNLHNVELQMYLLFEHQSKIVKRQVYVMFKKNFMLLFIGPHWFDCLLKKLGNLEVKKKQNNSLAFISV